MKRRKTIISTASACLLVALSVGVIYYQDNHGIDADKGINGPNESIAGDLCVFYANVPEGTSLDWKIDPPTAAEKFKVDTSGRLAYFASAADGRYVVFLASSIDGKAYGYTYVLVQGGEVPPIPPPPPPPPPPQPGKRFVLVVDETSEHGEKPWIASTLVGLETYLVANKHGYRFQDPDVTNVDGETPEWLVPFIAKIKEAKIDYPAIIVGILKEGTETGEFIQMFVDPLPQTAEKAVELVKEHGG